MKGNGLVLAGPVSEDVRAFRADSAYEHVERLALPRRVGTLQERRTARAILQAFTRFGLTWRQERFDVPLVAREVGLRVVHGAGLLALAVGLQVESARPLAALACWALAGLALHLPWRFAGPLGAWWPARPSRSANLVAHLASDDLGEGRGASAVYAPARVVFMAHYDSKSQRLPTGIRVALVLAGTTFCVALITLSLLALAGGHAEGLALTLRAGLKPLAAALAGTLGLLALNLTGNRSPGALDNATGVGTLLELARTWRPRREAPVEAWWVASGSEETGLDGARAFARRHEAWWREKPTLLINLDSVGAGSQVYLAGDPRGFALASQTAEALGVPWARLRVLGAGMDHQPFAARGLASLSLLGDVVGQSLVMHSRRDQIDRVDRNALEMAGRLAGEIAWAWARRHTEEESLGLDEGGKGDEPIAPPPSAPPPSSQSWAEAFARLTESKASDSY